MCQTQTPKPEVEGVGPAAGVGPVPAAVAAYATPAQNEAAAPVPSRPAVARAQGEMPNRVKRLHQDEPPSRVELLPQGELLSRVAVQRVTAARRAALTHATVRERTRVGTGSDGAETEHYLPWGLPFLPGLVTPPPSLLLVLRTTIGAVCTT